MIKRALISVYDKTGILELASSLAKKNVEIISSGGTYNYLKTNGFDVKEISEITASDEMLDGRVKTLHPIIHGGILAIRDNQEHMETLKDRKIGTIDLVVVNLYPFFEKVKEDLEFEEKVEFIDIGGPTMLRSAAKNFKDVVVLSSTTDYSDFIEMYSNTNITFEFKKKMAAKVFNLMSAYDGAIANFLFEESEYPEYLSISYKKMQDLRYGENPHQTAAYYGATEFDGAMNTFEILNGKELSYNNLKDVDIAYKVVSEFDEVTCCGLKHNTPCGVAIGENDFEAYKKAYDCDNISIFGGIVAFNTKVTKETALEMSKTFLEVIGAPEYDDDALEVLRAKKNLRVIKFKNRPCAKKFLVSVDGGILAQEENNKFIDELKTMTNREATAEELEDMIFAMKVVKYVKSNAIVVAKNKMAIGISGGEVNRIWAACQALERGEGATVMASDAFFPFDDTVKEANKYGIKAIIQPGGSMRDKDSIEACNENDMTMVMTGIRHFKH
ncbi:bifunctional phosphoribosylaminoimidazolecarboxamide formyltransferase/IMP cyclohydrolase [uncultured Clostridium sp.]|jgi:phosphoribosylaminoimidazolecarboxamide formyltransferase/IMP cyclohydrolase|uniref:bifunctional phosphoribosylaminoimidazolecarboxamide formyltransferase/IMP cyclohydrolase n=1 Tax=uncultured Clostridium sp. TaxID=59620 RepID=UPI00261F1ECD|nr:bifunctional phosphoribosylaminoimidazolecarboxamide formyltransferase/IMP cyclohydrolase [uncultured Clostridium sp.]